jgi:hypothetical protein
MALLGVVSVSIQRLKACCSDILNAIRRYRPTPRAGELAIKDEIS